MLRRLQPFSRISLLASILSVGACAIAGCGGDGGSDPSSATSDGEKASPVTIVSFDAALAVVEYGAATTLSWKVDGTPDDVTLDGVSVVGKTSLPVDPVRRQTFTLRALKGGATVATANVTVAARGIDVLAGEPQGGSNLDGPGNVAGFFVPTGVAFDAAGNAFVADSQNREIRKVTPAGVVSTIAGDPHAARDTVDGVGRKAHFSSPNGIVVHPSGHLYVTDALSHVVRKVMQDGTVTTVAGKADEEGTTNGAGVDARFKGPAGMKLLPNGDLLVADQQNCASGGSRRTSPSALRSERSDHAATTTCRGSSSPRVISRSTPAGNLYVTDACMVRQITPGGVFSDYAGSHTCGERNSERTSASFEYLTGITIDKDDNIYVADSGNRTVRKIAKDQVTTFAGSKTAIGDGDGPATLNGFLRPQNVAVRPNGEVLVSDAYANTLRTITPDGFMTTLAGTHRKTGTADGPVGTSRFGGVNGLTIDGDGSVVVADLGDSSSIGSVRRITRAGITSTIAGGGGMSGFLDGVGSEARLTSPLGITGDKNGTFWIAEPNSSTLRKLEKSGAVTTLAGVPGIFTNLDGPKGTGTLAAPADVVRDSKGNVYASQYQPGIRKLAPDGTLTTLAGGGVNGSGYLDGNVSVAQFNGPRALAIDALDNLYVADVGNYVVRKITPAGVVTTLAGTPKLRGNADGAAKQASFGSMFGLAVDAKGNVFVSDYDADAIRKIAPDGKVTTVVGTRGVRGNRPGPLPGSLSAPRGIALTAEGDLVVTTNAAVLQITAP